MTQYEKLRQLLEEERDDRNLQEGWQKLAYRGLALSLDDRKNEGDADILREPQQPLAQTTLPKDSVPRRHR
jgi:hypothetical protein